MSLSVLIKGQEMRVKQCKLPNKIIDISIDRYNFVFLNRFYKTFAFRPGYKTKIIFIVVLVTQGTYFKPGTRIVHGSM